MKRLSLQSTLIIVLLVSMIPINILLIFYYKNTLDIVEEKLVSSYESEFDRLNTRLDAGFDGIEQELLSAVQKSWSTFKSSGPNGILEEMNLIFQLKYIWQRQEFLEGGYLRTDNKDYVNVTYNSNLISLEEKENIEKALLDSDLTNYGFKQFIMETNNGQYYLVWNVNNRGYSWGFLYL